MRFPPSLLDDIRARLPVSQVVARKVSLKRAGREMKGLSPFKQEKTPSFFVNDHKGSWFDFSSGQNGDIFKFVMLTEGLSFPEAVERLAEEAGLPIPKASSHDFEREDERARLYTLLEAAARFFEEQLTRGLGGEARRYLDKRGLTAAAIARFRLGYAPNDRSALRDHLAKTGFTTAEMTSSGMLVSGEDIPVAYDRFRHRIIFPIADLRGRVIAFGGRALDPDAPAKYLNSPETPLFHKGANLYNAHNARGPAHDKGQLIASKATWMPSPLPRRAFRRPSPRLARRSPRSRSSCSGGSPLSRFYASTAMPRGGAPPSGRWRPCCRTCGRATACGSPSCPRASTPTTSYASTAPPPSRTSSSARPPPSSTSSWSGRNGRATRRSRRSSGLPWTPASGPSSPASAMPTCAGITSPSSRRHCGRRTVRPTRDLAGFDGRRDARFAGKRRNNTAPDWRVAERARAAGRLKRLPRGVNPASLAVRSNELAERTLPLPAREALLIVTLLNHPWLLEARCEEVAELGLTSPPLARLRDALLELLARSNALDRGEVRSQLTALGLDKVIAMAERAITHRSDKFAQADTDPASVESGWRHALALHQAQFGVKRALDSAEREFRANPGDETWARIAELQQRLADGFEMEDTGAA